MAFNKRNGIVVGADLSALGSLYDIPLKKLISIITGFVRVTTLVDARRLLFFLKESEKSVWLHW
jgi:hypothetical protein